VKFVLVAAVGVELEIFVLCGRHSARDAGSYCRCCACSLWASSWDIRNWYEHVGNHPFIAAADLYPRKQHWLGALADWQAFRYRYKRLEEFKPAYEERRFPTGR